MITMTAIGWTSEVPDTSGMTDPVRCTHSGDVYDLAKVNVTRDPHSGMSHWRTPCCGQLVAEEAGVSIARSLAHYVRLNRS
jgi:hypothetical protein